jgi:hypothetical protein
MISAIGLALSLLQAVLSQATKNGLAANIVADIQAAVDAVAKVHGTPVSKGQLDQLLVEKQW